MYEFTPASLTLPYFKDGVYNGRYKNFAVLVEVQDKKIICVQSVSEQFTNLPLEDISILKESK